MTLPKGKFGIFLMCFLWGSVSSVSSVEESVGQLWCGISPVTNKPNDMCYSAIYDLLPREIISISTYSFWKLFLWYHISPYCFMHFSKGATPMFQSWSQNFTVAKCFLFLWSRIWFSKMMAFDWQSLVGWLMDLWWTSIVIVEIWRFKWSWVLFHHAILRPFSFYLNCTRALLI